jgi:DNA-directed RNA polymerase subunit beta'
MRQYQSVADERDRVRIEEQRKAARSGAEALPAEIAEAAAEEE